MTNSSVHFSSQSSAWSTPQNFYDRLDDEFYFTLDPCATVENAKCERYFTIDDDGLSKPWAGRVFMNPPYGRAIGSWVRHAFEESLCRYCYVVVGLVPSRTDTAWWHDWVMQADEIRLVKGRLKFGEHKNSAPFPSAVVVWTGQWKEIQFSTMKARIK